MDAPPIPPRPDIFPSNGGYLNGYPSAVSPGGFSSYPYQSSYRSFPPYSGAFGGMSPYGSGLYQTNVDGEGTSDFVRFAEDSSRPAFETIFSIVNGFNSVSMLLESTYQAFHTSFRSILAVIEHGSRMKLRFGEILSSFAILRSLQSCYKRLLTYLSGAPDGFDLEEGFASAGSTSALAKDDKKPHSSLPVLVYLGIVFSAPYLLWKIMSNGQGKANEKPTELPAWATGEGDHIVAVAEHPFQARNRGELSFSGRQEMKIAPKEKQANVRGWLLATVDGKTTGLIPANYVKLKGKVVSPKPDIVNNVVGGTSR